MLLLGAIGCGSGGSGSAQDAGAIDAAAIDAAPDQHGSAYLFDENVVRTYEFILSEDARAQLSATARDEVYVPATLLFEGESYPNVALRFKGQVGSLQNQGPIDDLKPCFGAGGDRLLANCPKLGMKASFNELVPDGRWNGLKKLQFHSMGNDRSKLVESISYKLFRDMDVFAPRTAYVRLLINGELQGLYLLVEQIDGRFTRERFPDGGEGNLYKEVWPEFTTEAPYLNALKSNRSEMPSADKMVRFATDLAASTPATFESVLASWTDLDMLMRKMAVDRAIENWDGIVAWYCVGIGNTNCFNHNYYWYESTLEDKVWLIPWDVDRAMVWPSPIRTLYGMPDWDDSTSCNLVTIFFGVKGKPPACDALIGKMSSLLWPRYVAATQALLAGPMSAAGLSARVDELSTLIESYVEEDPYLNQATWQSDLTTFRSDLSSLRAAIETKIAP